MKKLKTTFLYFILIIFITPIPTHSEMYIWTDKNGVKHVSNTAPPQNIKNFQKRDEEAFDEEKHQRLMEQGKIDAVNEAAEKEKNKTREAEALHNKKLREKERFANSFFEKIDALSGKKFGDRRADVLRSIGTSLLNCPGTNLDTALRYYGQAESTVNDISSCIAKSPDGSEYHSTNCIDKLFENALNQKRTGDSNMGCSPEYIKTVEMEERVKRAERKAEEAKRKAKQAESAPRRAKKK